MMRGDAYRARALSSYQYSIVKPRQKDKQAQAQARSHYAVMLHREESDASWPSLPTNQEPRYQDKQTGSGSQSLRSNATP